MAFHAVGHPEMNECPWHPGAEVEVEEVPFASGPLAGMHIMICQVCHVGPPIGGEGRLTMHQAWYKAIDATQAMRLLGRGAGA